MVKETLKRKEREEESTSDEEEEESTSDEEEKEASTSDEEKKKEESTDKKDQGSNENKGTKPKKEEKKSKKKDDQAKGKDEFDIDSEYFRRRVTDLDKMKKVEDYIQQLGSAFNNYNAPDTGRAGIIIMLRCMPERELEAFTIYYQDREKEKKNHTWRQAGD
ncbi:hypothetical protein SAMD00019534_095310 [Acytostelium subglobosum LB1]|uniref:hypothetical protein n=1 Tax=Acytostelium subglobosum LB1 TaxID=1410327 RepID=UPI000644EA7F|nr:hypothetical protein SAMD00019534_095310 [Acytostelium subglobosum LB1]GAM26356.1 hypothetical protein SAMD00019534_095310 [Acytostelium subglobosum LB1]|eukprot:XP_012750910.1 hypothetical protein SAMD00019534_095310 [Acytostelium subglobosum LB1]